MDNQENGVPAADKAGVKLQKQMDALTSDNAQLTSDNAQLTGENAQLTGENAQLKAQVLSLNGDRDTLASANSDLAAQLEEKVDELATAEALIEQQTEQLKSAEVGQALGPVIVTYEKEQYRLLVPHFSHAGNLIESASLRQNPDLVRQLVEGGSGLLQKVVAAS